MYPEIYNHPNYDYPDRSRRVSTEDVFTCRQCQAYVITQPRMAGVRNRNHCPYCLWSRHVDLIKPGDRMSACKAAMEPIGLTVKNSHNKYGYLRNGELMLIHRCKDCGKVSINRIAADDLAERLLDIYQGSLRLDLSTRNQLEMNGIWLLQGGEQRMVMRQLRGVIDQ